MRLLPIFIWLITMTLNAQNLEVEGSAKVSDMVKDNTADSVVVRLSGGTLGVRDASSLVEYQVLSLSNDTLYLSNGGFVKLTNADWHSLNDTTHTTNSVEVNNRLTVRDTAYQSNMYSVKFDGMNDYVHLSENLSFGPTDGVSISLWVKDEFDNSHEVFIGMNHTLDANNKVRYNLAKLGGQIRFFFEGLNFVTNPIQQTVLYAYNQGDIQNKWIHLVGTVNNDSVSLYLNGKLVASQTFSGTIQHELPASTYKTLGAESNLGLAFSNANLDEVSIWNICLDSNAVKQIYSYQPDVDAEGLVAYWNFEEDSGVITEDQTSNNFDATLENGTMWSNDTYLDHQLDPLFKVEGGDIGISSPNNGIILTAPDGGKWRVRVDNGGTLNIEQIPD